MNRKHMLLITAPLCIFVLLFLFVSVSYNSSEPPLEPPLESPASEGTEMQAFDLDALTDFFYENVDSFEGLKTEVLENDIPFEITIWGGEISIYSTEKRGICESDIIGFEKIIFYMKDLSISRVHNCGIKPGTMTLFFKSNSDSAALYIDYGKTEDEIGGQLFECVPLYDQWIASAMVAE